ncbi:hypothetical protein [Phage f2b1]|nr:hypothetical protein [Phage f2b1]
METKELRAPTKWESIARNAQWLKQVKGLGAVASEYKPKELPPYPDKDDVAFITKLTSLIAIGNQTLKALDEESKNKFSNEYEINYRRRECISHIRNITNDLQYYMETQGGRYK